MKEYRADVLVIGAGLGGIAAALAALRLRKRVILTEETDWIGGQLTSQAVPPDENPWIDRERVGCSASYRELRNRIRNYYRRNYPLLPEALADPWLNPGSGNVSPLCHEPRVALAALTAMLAPYHSAKRLEVFLNARPISTESEGDKIRSVTILNREGDQIVLLAPYVLDATELGDLLPLANVEHNTGAESQAQTGEPHALEGEADPLDQQAISWCFVIDHLPGENHVIDRPADYDFWRTYQAPFWPDKQLSWTTTDPEYLQPVYRPLFTGDPADRFGTDLWHFRRILYRKHFPDNFYRSDIVLVNWPQIDYWLGPLVGVSEEEKQRHLHGARQLSLAMFNWMQTEAPRPEGGYGYPGLRLRGDVVGTPDGLAKAVYIRESRRIKAEFTVLEQHVGVAARGHLQGAEQFRDSVGIGSYRIDLHPSTAGRTYIDIDSWPFQIPLGALIPVRMENFLPANKNLGVTHITNGCFRLHPIEWNIGEAAGALAAYCLDNKCTPRQVYRSSQILVDFQNLLCGHLGVELSWPEGLRLTPRVKHDPIGI